jgi:3-deoxy-manno-octulosonate cytidylyltransferase (CMP-KDO synthetase)
MKPLIIIPARMESKRFPGKPLVEINKIPMIRRVADKASMAVGASNVIVATDSEEIKKTINNDFKCVIVKEECSNGTERIAFASNMLKLKKNQLIINVQGDEPLIDPKEIINICNESDNKDEIVTGRTLVECYESNNIVKTVLNSKNYLIYASRSKIPFYAKEIYKHVGIFSFRKKHLDLFLKNRKSNLEQQEDVEILRFLDMGIPIKVINVKSTQAVDVPEDIAKVENILNNLFV